MRHFGPAQKFLPEPVWIFWNDRNFFQKSKRNSGNGSRKKRKYPFKNESKNSGTPLAQPLFFVKTVSTDNLVRGIIFR